jgi:GT2 family glycosyltransferase
MNAPEENSPQTSGAIHSVTVGLLSWNGRDHLEICLEALARQRDPGVEWQIVVLDNGSSDGSVEWLREHHPNVRLIESQRNLGFCAGYNRLVEAITSDAVVLLNNDTLPREDWLAALVDALREAPPDVAAVSGVLVDWSGERLDFASGVMTFDAHALQRDFGRRLEDVELPADGSELLFACGGNMIVRRDVFRRLGGFDERFFAYLEDVDLGWRMWSAGHRVTLTRNAVAHHRSMATSQMLGLYNRGFLFERNAFLCCSKNYDSALWPAVMPSILLTLLSRTQSLLVQNNRNGTSLLVDPYQGHIANTDGAAADQVAEQLAASRETLADKWQRFGAGEFFVRAVKKALRVPLQALEGLPRTGSTSEQLVVDDERTIAQLRAISSILASLDQNQEVRNRIQSQRIVPDRELFARFPLYLIPTYPGDEVLFSKPAFAAWLEGGIELERASLSDLVSK